MICVSLTCLCAYRTCFPVQVHFPQPDSEKVCPTLQAKYKEAEQASAVEQCPESQREALLGLVRVAACSPQYCGYDIANVI